MFSTRSGICQAGQAGLLGAFRERGPSRGHDKHDIASVRAMDGHPLVEDACRSQFPRGRGFKSDVTPMLDAEAGLCCGSPLTLSGVFLPRRHLAPPRPDLKTGLERSPTVTVACGGHNPALANPD